MLQGLLGLIVRWACQLLTNGKTAAGPILKYGTGFIPASTGQYSIVLADPGCYIEIKGQFHHE